jgi:hypothetical protein
MLPMPLVAVVVVKLLAHWAMAGLPLVLLAGCQSNSKEIYMHRVSYLSILYR